MSITGNDFNDAAIKKFIYEVSNCSSTLTLALNLVMSYELSFEQKAKFKQSIIRNNLFYDNYNNNNELGEINLHNLLNQIFYADLNEKITSWQVRVRIIELKHLIGINETVYCVVEIGDQKFRTKEKHIDNLLFNDDDEVRLSSYFKILIKNSHLLMMNKL